MDKQQNTEQFNELRQLPKSALHGQNFRPKPLHDKHQEEYEFNLRNTFGYLAAIVHTSA